MMQHAELRRSGSRTPRITLVLACLALACVRDRDRPSPTEPDDPAALSVQLLEPAPGVTLVAGRTTTVRVSARDLNGENLVGIGFVARRFGSGNNATVDSTAVQFDGTRDDTREFVFNVPGSLPTSTQLDIFGIAYGPGTQARLSIPHSVIVAQCQTGQAGC